MILVDSSVWIDFLHAKPTPQTDFIRARLTATRFAIGDLILAEVLQGTRDQKAFDRALELFSNLPLLTIADRNVAVEAARNYQRLRAHGVTVRKTIDTLIATRCILDRHILLHRDRDFDPFVRHLGLRTALDDTGVH